MEAQLSPGEEANNAAAATLLSISVAFPSARTYLRVCEYDGSPLSFGAAVLKTPCFHFCPGSRLGMALSATGEMSAKKSRQCFIQLEIHGVGHPKRAFLTIPLVRWN